MALWLLGRKIENVLPQKLTSLTWDGKLGLRGGSPQAVTTKQSERSTKKMNQRKHGARLLGLLVVAALGVMAFAASAQAVAPGFVIKGVPVGALLATATAEQVESGTMLVSGLNFKLTCSKFTVNEGHIESNTVAKGVLSYTGCTTLSITKSPEEIHCHVKEPVTASAILLPAETTAGAPAVLAEKIKALVTLHLPEAALGVTPCVLPLDNTVTGEVCLEIDGNETEKPLVLASASIECRVRNGLEGKEAEGSTKDVLKYGAQTAVLDGKAHLFLTEAHKGFSIGVLLF